MKKNSIVIGASLLAIMCVATFIAKQLPKSDAKVAAAAASNTAAAADVKAGDSLQQAQQKMPNAKELNKLTAMQTEVAGMSDDAITKEIDTLKEKTQAMGLVKAGQSSNFNINAHPEAKEMLMRMAILRVEKAKRAQKAVAAKNDDDKTP